MIRRNSEFAIETENLTMIFKTKQKSNIFRNFLFPKYGSFIAVNDVNMSIKKGEIFGLLGPNGAGKTTIIQMICGLLYPTKGKIFINGIDIHRNSKIIKRLGVMFSDKMLYNRLTGYHNLKFFAKLYGIKNYEKKIKELAELLDLSKWLNEYVEHYSLGMRTKLAIARTLFHDPEILLLDEPTLGLDVINSDFIRTLLKNLNKTILITTHYLNEAEYLCDRIGFLFKGNIYITDTPNNLIKLFRKHFAIIVKTVKPLDYFINKIKHNKNLGKITVISKNQIKLFIEKKELISDLIKELAEYGIVSIFQESPSLEKIFIQLKKELVS